MKFENKNDQITNLIIGGVKHYHLNIYTHHSFKSLIASKIYLIIFPISTNLSS